MAGVTLFFLNILKLTAEGFCNYLDLMMVCFINENNILMNIVCGNNKFHALIRTISKCN